MASKDRPLLHRLLHLLLSRVPEVELRLQEFHSLTVAAICLFVPQTMM